MKDIPSLFRSSGSSPSAEAGEDKATEPKRHRLTRRLVTAVVVIIGIIAGLFSCSAAANATSGDVVRIIDGDTLVVSINNIDQTIRLLNVDTPETKDPNEPVECLGPEATNFLKESLPVGAHVRLDFDAERHDKYGRTLAAVFTRSGQLVNAEIAKNGLGIPVSFGQNTKYLAAVQSAHGEAKTAGAGLFSTSLSCTLPAQVEDGAAALAVAAAAQPETSAAAATDIAATVAAIAAAKSLQQLLSGGPDNGHPVLWAALAASDTARHLSRITTAIDRTSGGLPALEARRDQLLAAEAQAAADKKAAEEKAIADKKAAEEQAAAEKKAAEEQAAADKAAADAAAREAERIRNLPVYVPPAPRTYVAPAPPAYVPPAPPPAASDPYPGYHGPRCYAPGGKSWRPCP